MALRGWSAPLLAQVFQVVLGLGAPVFPQSLARMALLGWSAPLLSPVFQLVVDLAAQSLHMAAQGFGLTPSARASALTLSARASLLVLVLAMRAVSRSMVLS